MAVPEFDSVDVFNTLTDISEDIGRGASPRQILVRTLATAQAVTGADAACFVTVEPDAARVVGTTDSAAWLDGRYFPFPGSELATLLAGPERSRMFDPDTPMPWDLSGHGMRRVALARVTGVRTLGALAVFFADPDATLDGAPRAVFEYLAAATGSLAWMRPDTVPHQFGIVATAIPDGVAVLDRDSVVQSWNPAAHQLTGLSAVRAIGQPLPFPLPLPGQPLQTQLVTGRWVEVRSSTLGTQEARVVTFRDVTAPRMEDEGRDLFLATTSHELRTPLTVVKGYADTLANHWEDLDDESRRTSIDAIRDRTVQLAELVDRLLLANRSESGAVAMERAPFDLRSALADAVDTSRDPHPRLDLPEHLPWALGDRASIATIVNELLTNAVKYSPVGGDVTLTAGSDASSVYFQVSDRGIGVAPEHLDAVFDRFWQADRGDQRKFGGVGLGLYIIRRLLDRQGGWVTLRSRPDGGTVVEVRLPRVHSSLDERGPRTPARTEYARSGQPVASRGENE